MNDTIDIHDPTDRPTVDYIVIDPKALDDVAASTGPSEKDLEENRNAVIARIKDMAAQLTEKAVENNSAMDARIDLGQPVRMLASAVAEVMGIDTESYPALRSAPSRYTIILVDDGAAESEDLAFANLASIIDAVNTRKLGLTVLAGITGHASAPQPGIAQVVTVDIHLATLQRFEKGPLPTQVAEGASSANDDADPAEGDSAEGDA